MISVILVTYNSMAVLPNCLWSLEQSSSATGLEIVVADNGSVDGTVQWLEIYKTKQEFPFVAFVVVPLEGNQGFAYANNRAMEKAAGETLLLLNPDTVINSDAISVCAAVLARDTSIGAVGCRLVLPDGKLDRACKRSFPTLWNSFSRFTGLSVLFPRSRFLAGYNLTYLDEHGAYSVDCLCGAFMMVPAKIRRTIGDLDEDYFMYGEDIDWCLRIKRAGYCVHYEGTVSTLHLKGGNGGKRTSDSLKHFYETMPLYYTKSLFPRSSYIVAPLLRVILKFVYHVHVLIKGVKI